MNVIGRVALTAWIAVMAAVLTISLLAIIIIISYFAYAEFATVKASKALSDWEGEAIEPQDMSWEGVTLNNPGRALIQGKRTENGGCATGGVSVSLRHDRPENIGGAWTREIWTDRQRCVYLLEYGYASREDVEEFKRNSPAPMSTQVAEFSE